MPIRGAPTVSEVVDVIQSATSEGMLLGVLSRLWGRHSRTATREMLVLLEGDETVVVYLNPDSAHVEVRSLYQSDTLGRLGREVQDNLNKGQLP